MKKFIDKLMMVLMVGLLSMWTGCTQVPDDIDQTMRAFTAMTSPMGMQKSMFYVAYPNGTAKDYANYLFSGMGTSEWPPVEGSLELEPEMAESVKMAGMVVLPAGVAVVPQQPDLARGKQVVISYDEKENALVLSGYVNPAENPVEVRKTKIPKVQPSPEARLFYEARVEMGDSPESRF